MSHQLNRLPLVSFAAVLFAGCSQTHNPTTHYSTGPLVITKARIWTGDDANPEATCLVIKDGAFTYVGNDQSEATRLAGANAIHHDANSARIIPGMIDSHLHLISGGLQLSRIQLRDVPNRDAFVAAIAERAKKTPKGEWILGGRWSTESWPDPAQPCKEWIDAVTPNNPVLLSRMDGHGALANSVALKLAGITRDGPPDPPGGAVERDAVTRVPTGLLKEAAIRLVAQHIPPASDREMDAALRAAMHEANRHGLTGVHTMSPWTDVAMLDRADQSGTLTLRTRVFVMEDDWRPFINKVKSHTDTERVRIRGFKQFMDGSLGSRTAYMAAAFTDNPPGQTRCCGLLRELMRREQPSGEISENLDGSHFDALCTAACNAGYSPAVHSIGDQAIHLVLDEYERVLRGSISDTGKTGKPKFADPGWRPRVEHAQHLQPDDIPRFAKIGVVASMQPFHKADDGRYAETAIGPERCKTSYAFRSLLDAGAHVAFGSDWPVVTLNPFTGIHSAVTGRTLDGKTFVPEQNITVAEAITCYTSGAAYAAGDEGTLGKVKVGFAADFVILNQDPFTIPVNDLDKITVRETYVGGVRVWPSR
ncbi:MAG: amidohydrolase [Planctomycetes bacterium]|nr:amidohydrolase [Planctomycetota bacterium]